MNRYFQFLCDIVGGSGYGLLLWCLYRIEFYSLVSNDDNRGEDGKKLREVYLSNAEEVHTASSFLPSGPCSVLEMLIGLAFRMQDCLDGNEKQLEMAECFWVFLSNLDLDVCKDEVMDSETSEFIRHRIDILLDRTYESDGSGGIFPLINPKRDQRKVEIWYQMNEYLLENYVF